MINELRLGNHKLRIETGRYTIPKTPEHLLRVCQLCNTYDIEKEIHFLRNERVIRVIKFIINISTKYQRDILFLINLTIWQKLYSFSILHLWIEEKNSCNY